MNTIRRLQGLLAIGLIVVLGSCQLPWLQPQDGEDAGRPVSLVVGPMARTIKPDPVDPVTLVYRLTLTPTVGTPVVFEDYTLGVAVTASELVPGSWTIQRGGLLCREHG